MPQRMRLIVAGLVIYFLGAAGYGATSYLTLKHRSMAEVDQRLLTAAHAVVAILDGNSFHDNLPETMSDEAYQDLCKALSRYANPAGLKYIYGMIRQGEQILFTASSMTEEELAAQEFGQFMDPYEDATPEMLGFFSSSQPVFLEYTDKWGAFRSVFVPMRTASGKVWLAAADIALDDVQAMLHKDLLHSALGFLGLLLLLLPLGWGLRRRFREERRFLQQEIDTATRSIGELNADLQHKMRDAEESAAQAKQATAAATAARDEALAARSQGMREAAERVEHLAKDLLCAMQHVRQCTDTALHDARAQQQHLAETMFAMQEMRRATLAMTDMAGQASQAASRSQETAVQGGRTVQTVVASIGTVHQRSTAMREGMASLEQSAQDIGRILNTINDIADQTNLLALNAAIEAARAGDAGRGFAVVADEVRKLADKTTTATREVESLARGMTNSTQHSMQEVAQAVTGLDQAAATAGEAGATLERLQTLARDAFAQITAIDDAARQQSTHTSQVESALEAVGSRSDATATAMEESDQALARLDSQIQGLREFILELARHKGTPDETCAGEAAMRPLARPRP